jgi:hypothetical protein
MKTSSDIIDAINRLETTFPVGEWRCGDIDLWPSYRLRLYGAAIDRMLLNQAPPRRSDRLRKLAGTVARRLWRVPLAALKDFRAHARLNGQAAALFFSDGVSFTKMDDHWFDRIVDPVIQELAAQGLQSAKLTPLAEVHVPRLVPSRFVQPSIDRIKFFATSRPADLHLPEFAAFLAAAQDIFAAPPPSMDWLRVQAARLEALALWFAGQIRASGAAIVFVNTYYSLEGQALVQAARRLGCHSVDLQHGLQGAHHAAYARWANVPKLGYSTLPDEFWVWSQDEAQAIAAWRGDRARHMPRISGNYWLQRWIDEKDPVIAHHVAQARALVQPGRVHALACLSWGISEDETTRLLQAAQLCGPDVVWWWRLHPVEAHKRGAFAAQLRAHGLDDRHLSATTDWPLYALIRSANVVLAHSSTVIAEAAQLGVPSVVTSDYGAQFFATLIDAGTAAKAIAPPQIAAAIPALAQRFSAQPLAHGPDNRLADAVQALFPAPKPRISPKADG